LLLNIICRHISRLSPEQRDQFGQLYTAQQLADKLKQDALALAAPLVPHMTREQLEEVLQSEEYTRSVFPFSRRIHSANFAVASYSGAHWVV